MTYIFFMKDSDSVLLVNQNEIVNLCQSGLVIPDTCLIVYSRRRRDGLFRPILSPCKLNIFFFVHTTVGIQLFLFSAVKQTTIVLPTSS